MNKQEAISKINKLGNISNIIVKVCQIFVIIGLVCLMIGMVITMALPKELVEFEMGATADIHVDLSSLGVSLTEEEKASMLQGIKDGFEEQGEEANVVMDMNGSVYEAVDVDAEGSIINIKTAVETFTIGITHLWVVFGIGLVTLAATFVTLLFAGKLCKAFRDCQSPFEDNIVKSLNMFAYSLLPWVVLSSLSDSVSSGVFTNNFEIMVGVDLGVVLLICVVFILAYIFKYGAVLQQESDETL